MAREQRDRGDNLCVTARRPKCNRWPRTPRPSRLTREFPRLCFSVSVPQIEFINGNLHLPELNLWLDPHEPQADKVFVSHAHSDHIASHREIILSAPTAKLMRARLAGNWREHVMNFGEARRFENGETAFDLTLLPAGHIFGSAMALVLTEGVSLLYTGDFK